MVIDPDTSLRSSTVRISQWPQEAWRATHISLSLPMLVSLVPPFLIVFKPFFFFSSSFLPSLQHTLIHLNGFPCSQGTEQLGLWVSFTFFFFFLNQQCYIISWNFALFSCLIYLFSVFCLDFLVIKLIDSHTNFQT